MSLKIFSVSECAIKYQEVHSIKSNSNFLKAESEKKSHKQICIYLILTDFPKFSVCYKISSNTNFRKIHAIKSNANSCKVESESQLSEHKKILIKFVLQLWFWTKFSLFLRVLQNIFQHLWVQEGSFHKI